MQSEQIHPQDAEISIPGTSPSEAQEGAGAEKYKLGQRVWGPILRLTETQAVVALGEDSLDEGVLELIHLRDEFGNLNLSEGDSVQAFIVELDPVIKLAPSLLPPASEVMRRLHEALSRNESVRGRVMGVNRGGLEIDVDGRRAFCPYSQIEIGRCEHPEIYINHILDFRVMELDEEKRRVVLSHRAILEEERKEALGELRSHIKEGVVMEGVVTRLQPFGAFVDIGGIEGLVHVSEITHDRIDHPSAVLRTGEKVRVRVLEISKDKKGQERIKLSIKALIEDPWTQIDSLFHTGDIVTGKVVRVTDFGAFVKIHPGIEGLLHVSQYKPRNADVQQDAKPGEAARVAESAAAVAPEPPGASGVDAISTAGASSAVGSDAGAASSIDDAAIEDYVEPVEQPDAPQTGEEIVVRIARIEKDRRRISLNLREPERAEKPALDASVGEVLDGVVRSIRQFGVFVDLPSLGQWASGLLPAAETGLPRGTNLKRKFNPGDKVRVEVIEIDDRGRIRLSQRSVREREDRIDPTAGRGRGLTTAPPGGFNILAEAFKRAQERKERGNSR